MGSIIKNLPIADLRAISIEAMATIDRVENVRTVVLNPDNAEAFMRVPRTNVRSHLIIKPQETLRIGQVEFNDQYLNSLPDDTRLVILGHLLVDGFTIPLFLKKIQSMRMYGQILYSDSRCAGALLSRMERLQGQFLKMPANSVRWIGSRYVDADAFASVAGRTVASIGQLILAPSVTPGDITNNIKSMTQIGEIKGKEEAICTLLSVCNRRLGTYNLS